MGLAPQKSADEDSGDENSGALRAACGAQFGRCPSRNQQLCLPSTLGGRDTPACQATPKKPLENRVEKIRPALPAPYSGTSAGAPVSGRSRGFGRSVRPIGVDVERAGGSLDD